jgi:hypothetical protein
MHPRFVRFGCAFTALALAACQKQPEATPPAKPEPPKPLAVEVVKPAERSRHFVAVNRQLELGGTLYGYVDVDGDVLKFVDGLRSMLDQIAKQQPNLAPFLKQDYGKIAQTLGLTDVKAVGFSSVPDGTGFFRNRVFLYTPDQRHGLLAGLGGKPAAFSHVALAPADTDFFAEAEIDLPVVYAAVRDVVAQIGGETTKNQLEDNLRRAGEQAAISVLNLINGLKGRASIVLRLDPEKTIRIAGPQPLTLPAISLLIRIDGAAQGIAAALDRSPAFQRSDRGDLHTYALKQRLPIEGLSPVLATEGGALYLATSPEFLTACREQKSGLAQTAEFRTALEHVGSEGNGLAYASPRLFARLRQFEVLNPALPEQTKTMVHLIATHLPSLDRPLVTVRTNLPDGILVRSYWNRSLKQEIAMAAIYNPVSVGVIAAIAIPAFQKTRTAAQDKTVINNLRLLSIAAERFYAERGVTAATYDDLVGPRHSIQVMQPVMGENYRAIRFLHGQPLRVRLPDGRVLEYRP